ncbi:hypothetical protein C8R31_11021 [Nitrosospira sp. Nsp2]|uniref:hypothetical protein n=1 Tax=Nitrosospira sp. Nsp2 TaxID=136548 RepID=UPI000D3F4D54|nr:hypothetical protein [Nitrosospira sp. Nsp2]PTR13607.1 hypothetical protein C8R31_11021 [Nitrosospira sp. Nsp2]
MIFTIGGKKSWGGEEKVYGAADAFSLKEAELGSQLEGYGGKVAIIGDGTF